MKKKIGLILALVAFVCLIFFSVFVRGEIQNQEAVLARDTALKAGIQKESAYRDQLSEWVFSRSSKISRGMSRQIVDEVFRYDHPILLLAICQAESEFSPTAISSVGAMGLGQIRWPVWGKSLHGAGIAKEARDLFDFATNIRATNFIVGTLIKSTNGNPVSILEAYVGGKHKPYVEKVATNFMHLSMIKKS